MKITKYWMLIFVTGSVWPPFPGANQGYWARRAGFYNTLPNFGVSALQESSSVVSTVAATTQIPAVTGSTPPTTTLASAARLLQLQNTVTAAPAVPVYNPYSFTIFNNKLP